MAKYEEKFIVVNKKHLTHRQEALLSTLLDYFDLPDRKYYVCNQDEPYADKIISLILEGESQKETPTTERIDREV